LGIAPRQFRSICARYFQVMSGPDREHVAGQRHLDWQPVLRRFIVVQPADPAIGGQPGIRRDPGAGDEQHPARRGKATGDAIDGGECIHGVRISLAMRRL
jgi:hypothetical protein